MPYASSAELPAPVRRVLPPAAQDVWRNVFNSTLATTRDEGRAAAGAWSTLRRLGWAAGSDGKWHKTEKQAHALTVAKLDHAQGRVFGWAYVCKQAGAPVIDHSGEVIPPDELEPAVYEFNLGAGLGSDMHSKQLRGVGELIESTFYDGAKWEALGVPAEVAKGLNEGWWVGFQYDPAGEHFANVVAGKRLMFSIAGYAEDSEEVG